MSLLLALALTMLPHDRAVLNAALTMAANGIHPKRVGCTAASDGYACVGTLDGGGYVILHCTDAYRDVCSMQVFGKRRK
jgi:hypothetical protein